MAPELGCASTGAQQDLVLGDEVLGVGPALSSVGGDDASRVVVAGGVTSQIVPSRQDAVP